MKSVIVVGAGFSGLSAALELARCGAKVLVLEGADGPGGRARRFVTPEGYAFDSGPTLVVMTDVLRRALGQRAFEGLSFRRLEPGYRVVWPDGTSFDLSSNIATLLGEIERFDPAPPPSSTLAFLADVHELYLEARSKILERDDSLLSFVGRLASRGRFRPWALGSLRRFVQRFFDNPRVVEALTFQSLYLGTSPLIAPAMYALLAAEEILGGVWYPAGGTGAIVAALVRQCEEHGVTFSFGSRVTRVLDDGHRARGVESATGTHYADGIVVTADREVAMQRLFAEPGHEPSPRYGHSAMVWYLGIDRRIDLPHHTVMLPSDPWTAYAQLDQGLLPSAPLVYLCNPAASDESVAPPGHSALVLLAPVPNRSTLFAFDARHFFERVMTVVERHAGPVAERIVYRSARGPAEFERELDVMHGAAFGPDHLLDQMGPFRPSIRHPRLSNVVFAGSGTKPGSGVPMVLISGRLAGQRLAKAIA